MVKVWACAFYLHVYKYLCYCLVYRRWLVDIACWSDSLCYTSSVGCHNHYKTLHMHSSSSDIFSEKTVIIIGCLSLCITKTRLYNIELIKAHIYIAKLRLLQEYTFLLFLLKNIDWGYSLEPPRRGGSNEYPQSVFWAGIWKISEFYIWKFSVLEVTFSIYLNSNVFVMVISILLYLKLGIMRKWVLQYYHDISCPIQYCIMIL